MQANHGVFIEQGPSDWQIVQQDGEGWGAFTVSGRYAMPADHSRPMVYIRLVQTANAAPVARHLDWQPVETRADGAWSATISGIPAGGLYRLETQLRADRPPAQGKAYCPEWAMRGDARDFLGVGDLWVIAGQSNSAGYGKGVIEDPPELGVHLLANSLRWRLASHPFNDSTDTAHPVNTEWANSGHAPWLQFARAVKRAVNHPVGLLQTSLGGSPLKRWNPREGQPGAADLHDNMVEVVRAVGGKVRGILWYQGCSDTGPDESATYLTRFTDAVAAWRDALGNPGLPVITVQINRVTSPQTDVAHEGWTRVREAQRQAARNVPGVIVVPSSDLSLSDHIHTSPAGNLILGQRAAEAALDRVYGLPRDWRAPEIDRIVLGSDRRRVTFTVSHVSGALRSADDSHQPFRIVDSSGVVPVERIAYDGARIELELGRTVGSPATLTLGYGAHPPLLPVDMTRNLPILACEGMPIEV